MQNTNKTYLRCLLFTFLVMAGMIFTGKKAAPLDDNFIYKLELAETPAIVIQLIAPENSIDLGWLKINTLIDYLFLVAYSSVFFFSTKWLLENFNFSGRLLLLPFIWFLPAIFDAIENLYILSFCGGDFRESSFSIYYTVVRIKWAMVPFGIISGFSPLFIKAYAYLRK